METGLLMSAGWVSCPLDPPWSNFRPGCFWISWQRSWHCLIC